MKSDDWPLEERRVADEIVERAVRLVERLAEPLKLHHGAGDAGTRMFVFGDWKFKVQRHTPVFYSKRFLFGEVKGVQVWNQRPDPGGRIMVFVYNKENPPYQNSDGKPWSMSLWTCLNQLLPDLRRTMVLDDLAECG